MVFCIQNYQQRIIRFFAVIGFVSIVFAHGASLAYAQRECTTDLPEFGTPTICLQTPLGTIDHVSGVPDYLGTFYNLFVGSSMILSAFMIVIGGVRWLFARGNSGKIGEAKKSIGSAIMGMLLVFVSIALLRVINPDLLSLRLPKLESVKKVLYYGARPCVDLPVGTKVQVGSEELVVEADTSLIVDKFECQRSYNIVDSGRQVCRGTSCAYTGTSGMQCIPTGCAEGLTLFGSLSDITVKNLVLMGICPDNKLVRTVVSKDVFRSEGVYELKFNQDLLVKDASGNKYCGALDPTGYVIGAKIDEKITGANGSLVFDRGCRNVLRKKNPTDQYATADGGDEIVTPVAMYSKTDLEGINECNISFGGSTDYQNHPPIAVDQRQWKHATKLIRDLVYEINKYLIDNNGTNLWITSVSDDNIFNGSCKPWLDPPSESYSDKSNCQHVFQSAHYGGSLKRMSSIYNEEFSCAMDIAPENKDYNALEQAVQYFHTKYDLSGFSALGINYQCEKNGVAQSCSSAGNDHLHLSVSGCGVNL